MLTISFVTVLLLTGVYFCSASIDVCWESSEGLIVVWSVVSGTTDPAIKIKIKTTAIFNPRDNSKLNFSLNNFVNGGKMILGISNITNAGA